jgi:hypothetical protein
MDAKDIAERYAGRIVKCKVKPDAKSPVFDAAGNAVTEFEARILGWKKAQSSWGNFNHLSPTYVCVEVLSPHSTQTKLSKFNQGYNYTHDKNPDGYGKKILPNEILLPADPGTVYTPRTTRTIPEWPHKCRDCGSPAQILGMNIDCSNPSCKNKYRTHSGLDLFLPKDIRERLAKPKQIEAKKK